MQDFQGWSFVLSRISKGVITNLETPVIFLKKHVLSPHLFSGIAKFTDKKSISDKSFVSVQSWITLFCVFSSLWRLHTNFFPVSIPKVYGVKRQLYRYPSYTVTVAITANVKRMVTWLYVAKKSKKLNFMAPSYGCGLTGSRLEPLWRDSLLFTTMFPQIPGTHFIDLGRMKCWVDLGATHWFWTQDPWI